MATNWPTVFEGINQYSNLALAVFTAFYVVFTYLLVRSTNRSVALNALPIFFPKVSQASGRIVFSLSNHSAFPAYDVDIWIIGHYYQEDDDYKTFLKDTKSVEIDFSKNYAPGEPQSFGVVDHAVYYAFPPKNKVEFEPQFEVPPTYMHVVLQFRDTQGKNYLYQTSLSADITGDERLKQGFLKTRFSNTGRIEWETVVDRLKSSLSRLGTLYKLTAHISNPRRLLRLVKFAFGSIVAHSRFTIRIDGDIKDILKRTFPAGYQKSATHDVEDRGIFTSL